MLVDFCWLLATVYDLKQEDRDFRGDNYVVLNYPCVLNLDNLEECERGLFSSIML